MTYTWGHLNRSELGKHGAELIEKELEEYGFKVLSAQKNSNDNSFVVCFDGGPLITILPRTSRLQNTYAFMSKKNKLSSNLYMVICMLKEMEKPRLFLIPSEEWNNPNALLVSRDYKVEGQKSKPEWGVQISGRTMELLQTYKFSDMVEVLQGMNP